MAGKIPALSIALALTAASTGATADMRACGASEPANAGKGEAHSPVWLVCFPGSRGGAVFTRDGKPRLAVEYGRGLDPDSFKATLNGRDVTEAFDLLAGSEQVRLPFRPGGNSLVIQATGSSRYDFKSPWTIDGLAQVYRVTVIFRPGAADAVEPQPDDRPSGIPDDRKAARASEGTRTITHDYLLRR